MEKWLGASVTFADRVAVRNLAMDTGSNTPVELLDMALSTLQWVVEKRQAGKRILAIDSDGIIGELWEKFDLDADELLVS